MPEKREHDISKILKSTKGGGLKKPVKPVKPVKKEEVKPAEAPKPEEITAELVASKEFSKKVQGYDPQEVRAFLQAVAQRLMQLEAGGGASTEELEALKKRVAELEEENKRLREEAQSASQVDETEAAMGLLKHAKEVVERAKADAERLKKEAEAEAQKIVEEAKKEALLQRAKLEEESKELQEQVERLRSFKLELVSRMEGVLEELRASLEKYKE